MILMDTDTLSLLFYQHQAVVHRVTTVGVKIAITVITRIEILRGRFDSVLKAKDGGELRRALARLEELEIKLAPIEVVPFDDGALLVFDSLRQNRKLKKIGLADLLIASVALARKARLITRNLKDFEQVPGLQVENWAD